MDIKVQLLKLRKKSNKCVDFKLNTIPLTLKNWNAESISRLNDYCRNLPHLILDTK